MTNLVDSALEFWLTSGRYTEQFEKELEEFLDVRFCSVVNSGSSANLVAFMALTSPLLGERSVRPGDEVITVAAGFPITVTPMLQYKDLQYASSYNVGPDEESCFTTGELVSRFCAIWNQQNDSHLTWYHESDGGPHEANFLKLDCTKLKQTFGWKPRWNSNRMLEKRVEWMSVYRQQGDITGVMARQILEYIDECKEFSFRSWDSGFIICKRIKYGRLHNK